MRIGYSKTRLGIIKVMSSESQNGGQLEFSKIVFGCIVVPKLKGMNSFDWFFFLFVFLVVFFVCFFGGEAKGLTC